MESAITGPGDWRGNAACRDADPDLFFPIGTTGPALRQVQEAIRICQTCPIQVRCLAWALEQGVTDGVWGGTTAEQRRAIRTAFAGTPAAWPQLHNRAVAPDAAGYASRPVSG
ncbi:MAG TPA: WhiB family transcriptional regulator [Trebonia sp.]|nr:WhiB family transcriptional regulator [Trebonia sp.]